MCSFRSAGAAAALLLATTVCAQPGEYPGIGRKATDKEVAAWDIDVRPDFKGLPKGSGSVTQGQVLWEEKCASCHGVFGESNEVFQPLVGGTTANGHVIKSYDRFVALPSRRALASKGGTEYQVRVCYSVTGKCTTTSVWDVGPWNTKDDYWNPSSIREMWKDLPQGKPEAQAAYQDGYNGGLDQFGRRVANAAGIDIADGTFWTDLGMSNNDWVNVTYLWTTGGGTPTGLVIDSNNANNDTTKGYIQLSANWAVGANTGFYGNNYYYANTQAISDPAVFFFYLPAAATKTIDAWWVAGSNRSTTAPFVITNASGTNLATVSVNQQINGSQWNTLGTWSFPAGWNKVQLSRWTTAGFVVVADAIQVR